MTIWDPKNRLSKRNYEDFNENFIYVNYENVEGWFIK